MSLSILFATEPPSIDTHTVTKPIYLRYVFFKRIIFAYAIQADAQHSTRGSPYLARQPKRPGYRSRRLHLFYKE
jgi:hypothetical protein